MSEFKPVSTMAELDLLDQDDILAGYMAGLSGEPEPDSTKSRGFHHGYQNAKVDRGVQSISAAQQQLAREFVAKQRAH